SVVRAVGLTRFVLDIGHASIARALLDPLPAEHAGSITQALAQKDAGALDDLLRGAAGIDLGVARALAALPDLHGGGDDDPRAESVFARGQKAFAGTAAERPLGELRALWDEAQAGAWGRAAPPNETGT